MSMTLEEAVERLKRLKRSCRDLAVSMPEEPGWALHGMALDMAISALRPVSREQVEKVWRGKWIDAHPGTSSCKCTKCGVADLKDWLPPESKKIPYGELVGAPYPYNLQGPLVYADEVCNLVEEAADAITALLNENARLKNRKSMWRKLLEAVKSAFGWEDKAEEET